MITRAEQAADYARLEPIWNGALEASGHAPGLSRYLGRSSIFQSPNWERFDTLLHGECMTHARQRGADRRPRVKHCLKREAEIERMLRAGVSYGQIARAFEVSPNVVRRVARLRRLERRMFAGANRPASA